MANAKLKRMKEIYLDFPEQLKENLSMIRIFEYSDLTRVPKEHKKLLEKEYAKLKKEQNALRNKIVKSLSRADSKVVKENYQDFMYESDILGLDLENADNLITIGKDEIKRIKSEYDEYKRAKRKESTKKLEKLRSEVLLYCIAREKIKFYYDAISNDEKYGLKAIKIRKIYEKQKRKEVNKIDNRIAKLTKILNNSESN